MLSPLRLVQLGRPRHQHLSRAREFTSAASSATAAPVTSFRATSQRAASLPRRRAGGVFGQSRLSQLSSGQSQPSSTAWSVVVRGFAIHANGPMNEGGAARDNTNRPDTFFAESFNPIQKNWLEWFHASIRLHESGCFSHEMWKGVSNSERFDELSRQHTLATKKYSSAGNDATSEKPSIANVLLGHITKTVGYTPPPTAQHLCNQIVENGCMDSNDVRLLIDLLNDGLLSGQAASTKMYTELVRNLVIEGESERAREVIEQDTVAAQLPITKRARHLVSTRFTNRDKIGERRRKFTALKKFGLNGVHAADRLFQKLLAKDLLEPSICAVHMHNCLTAADMLNLINTLVDEHNIPPHRFMYDEWLQRLLVEGDFDRVDEFLRFDLSNVALRESDQLERRIRDLMRDHKKMQSIPGASSLIDKQRYVLLFKWFGLGAHGQAAIRHLFGELAKTQQLDTRVCNALLKFCLDSESQIEMLDNMTSFGVRPDIISYTVLVTRLRAEGDEKHAKRVILQKLTNVGKEPDEKIIQTLALSGDRLSKMRSSIITNFAQVGNAGYEAAWRFHDKLIERREFDARIAKALYVMCRTPEEEAKLNRSIDDLIRRKVFNAEEAAALVDWNRRIKPMSSYFVNNPRNHGSPAEHFVDLIRGRSTSTEPAN